MCLLTKTETSALEIEKNPSYIEKNAKTIKTIGATRKWPNSEVYMTSAQN